MAVTATVVAFHCFCKDQRFHHLLTPGPPNRLTPGSACAPLAVPFGFLGCTILGSLGAFVPDLPGVPVKDFLNLSLPIAMCGDTTDAMFPALVAPAVAASCILLIITSFIFM